MTLARGRIIKAEESTQSYAPLMQQQTTVEPRTRVIRAEVLAAQEQAERLLAAAERAAQQRLEAAEQAAAQAKAEAAQRGYEDGLARAAAEVVALVAAEQAEQARSLDRVTALAKLLAERLIGHSLKLDESIIEDMARVLLLEVRGARRVTIATHPDDVQLLERTLVHANPLIELRVEANSALRRGDFRLTTDLGSLEGSLGARLELLATKLRQGLTL
jgi:flagellar biosynthesis/type III secretory pathway protein FliH